MKKNFIFLIILVLTLFVINNQTTNAQKKRLNSSPQTFRTFFSKFKSAVAKNDKTGVASMTSFPFKYGFDVGDEGTMSKTQFVKRFNEIFGESPSQFLMEKNPLFSREDGGSYIISTDDAAHLIFVKKGSSFKLTAYIVEP
jgi:delta-aminolevulinic acid dehydratase/porphobilinogen synthase